MLSDRDDFFGNMKWRNWISRMPRILVILLIPITHGCSTLAGPIDPPSWISSSGNVTETLDNSTVESGSSTPEAEAGARKSDDELQLTQTAAELEQNQPISKADPLSYTEKGQQFLRRLSGQQAGNTERAKQWYQRANEIFDQAAAEKSELAKKTFEQAAELFAYAGDISPGSALQQTLCSCRVRVYSLRIVWWKPLTFTKPYKAISQGTVTLIKLQLDFFRSVNTGLTWRRPSKEAGVPST